jgi:hypothetical protein
MDRLAQWQIWFATAILSIVAALSIWYGVTRHGQAGLSGPVSSSRAEAKSQLDRLAQAPAGAPIEGGAALEYAIALQENNCPAVIDLVWWIQERLRIAQISDGADAIRSERERLCARITNRAIGQGRLTAEGIEDQYIFRPGAKIEVQARDDGMTGLDKPVEYRVWFTVTFGSINSAIFDESGRAIRSMRIGVNVSPDGYILKAGVTGNTEIDWSAIDYDWTGK